MRRTIDWRERLIAGAVSLAVMGYAVILMGPPAAATHGGIHPTFRSERVYFHCHGPTKVHNANWFVNGPAPWDANPPAQSLAEGGGCGATSIPDIASEVVGSDSNPDNPQSAVFRDTFVGNIESMTIELHNLLLSQVRPRPGIPPGMAPRYDVGIRISIDGKPLWPGEERERGVRVGVTPVLSADGLTEKMTFSVRWIGCAEEITDAAGNVIDVTTDGVATDDGDGTTRHTIVVTVDQWYADRFAAWVWDATDVAAGITFNADTLPRPRLNPVPPATCPLPPVPGRTERVSVASDGAQADSSSSSPAMDASGRYVAFSSAASDLVPGDTNNSTDIFVHDRETGFTERVSVATDGTQADRAAYWPDISADGRFVAFYSWARNLVPDDTNGAYDVFVHDRETGVTERVSVASDGSQGNARSDASPSISADGRFVAFPSWASNLVPGDTNGVRDVFVHDRETGVTERASVATDGTQANGNTADPDLTPDGRTVAFWGEASNLVPDDTNGMQDVFFRDLDAGVTERVSVASDESEGDGGSQAPSITGDGGFIAFQSQASNLVPGDANGTWDVFVRDRGSEATELVSVGRKGQGEGDDFSLLPEITPDGRYVLFQSQAENLVASDTNLIADMFVRDRIDGETERVSLNSAGEQITGGLVGAWIGAISTDARHIAFASDGLNVVPDDTNEAQDIFVRERHTSETPSPSPSPTDEATESPTPDPSPTESGSRGSYPVTPNDALFGEEEALPFPADSTEPMQWGPRKIAAPQAWQEERATGFGVRIAVLDTGVDLQHEDLQCAGKLDVGPGSDVVANDSNPDDENGHGTHVAGIIGACTNNGTGVAGVAPDATLVPVRVLSAAGSGTDAQLIAGLDKAVELGVHVVNMSLGYLPGKEIINNVAAIDSAIGRARDAGIVLVAAAGNDSFPLCEYPALAEDVICVGATDPRDVKAVYSVFPNKTDAEDTIGPGMVAPGGTGAPFCDTYSENVLSTIPLEFDTNGCTDVQGYANNFGTSMAAPHVAGAAALVYDRLGGERSEDAAGEVIAALIDNADDLGAPGYDPVFGWGRLNASRAVQAISVGPDPTPTPTSTESGSPSPSPSESPQPDVSDVSFTEDSAESGQYSDETLFEAQLTDSSGDPLAGRALSFEIAGNGSRSFSATTNDDGVAVVTPRLEEKPGPYQVTVRFAGDDDHAGDADTMSFVVDKEDSALDLTVEGNGNNKTLSARLSDLDTSSEGIADRTIDFYSDGELIGSRQTDADGVASVPVPPAHRGNNRTYEAVFAGDDFYLESSDERPGKGGNSGGGNGAQGAEATSTGRMLLM